VAEIDRPLPDLVDAALRNWRQGDCVLGEQWFLFRSDPDSPLTREAVEATADGSDTVDAEVLGLTVVTQSCDVVRTCRDRPFVEVCPLIPVEEIEGTDLRQVERARFPRYAFIPGIADRGLVADLDRVMTVEKSVLMKWERIPGCADDLQRRDLQLAIARKRSRAAFPDDFVVLAKRLQARLKKKHGKKESPEGCALRALREIRVRAAPSWDAPEVHVFFWFVRDDDQESQGLRWDEHLRMWLALVPPDGKFTVVEGVVVTLDDLTAREYVESDPLDLDHLSLSTDD
jgi:hypothetical protein